MANDIVHLAEVVSETADQTGVGKESMDLTQTRIHEVAKETDAAQNGLTEMTQDVESLHERTASIDNLVVTVNSIAEQTNLLALNASIEAARAGEHGAALLLSPMRCASSPNSPRTPSTRSAIS